MADQDAKIQEQMDEIQNLRRQLLLQGGEGIGGNEGNPTDTETYDSHTRSGSVRVERHDRNENRPPFRPGFEREPLYASSIETILEFMRLTDQDRVSCASFMFKKDARHWWSTVKMTRDVTVMTWADFVREFNQKYYNSAILRAQQDEFMNLKQGSMTVIKAVNKFEQTEEDRLKWIMDMFKPDIALAIESGGSPPTTVARWHYAKFCPNPPSQGNVPPQNKSQAPKAYALQAQIEGPPFIQGRLEAPEPEAKIFAYTKGDVDAGTSNVVTAFMDLMNRVFAQYLDKFIIELKNRLTTTPTLTLPTEDEDFVIFSDASKLGWLELVKDYDCEILYHPGKANRVADALSRKTSATLMSIQGLPKLLQSDINSLELEFIGGQLSALTLQPTIMEGMRGAQELDPNLFRI
ncbi:hypothetical protein UlMin_004679 [Ulmus minor]